MKSSTPYPENEPLVSIIIPNYNTGNTLRFLIDSIIEQDYPSKEVIVIDGGSTDNTTDILQEYDQFIDKMVSEKDKGIYDAMNKGIGLSNGKWLLFLGADDRLIDKDVLSEVFKNDISRYHLLYGTVIYPDNSRHKSSYNRTIFLKNTIHHQAAFYNRKCFKNFRFNASYKVLADYELNLKLYLDKKPAKDLDMIISACGKQGISKRYVTSLYKEEFTIKKSLLKWYTHPLIFIWVWMKYIYKVVFFRDKELLV